VLAKTTNSSPKSEVVGNIHTTWPDTATDEDNDLRDQVPIYASASLMLSSSSHPWAYGLRGGRLIGDYLTATQQAKVKVEGGRIRHTT